ncbi:MAG: hypothetical protein QXP81_09675 [Nitrososphaerota archaeon]
MDATERLIAGALRVRPLELLLVARIVIRSELKDGKADAAERLGLPRALPVGFVSSEAVLDGRRLRVLVPVLLDGGGAPVPCPGCRLIPVVLSMERCPECGRESDLPVLLRHRIDEAPK